MSDELVLHSWRKNSQGWINAVKGEEIRSRNLVTNNAIIDAIVRYSPNSVLDIGCGEGWLTRKLTNLGISTLGVDGVSELIESAKSQEVGKFLVATYQDITQKTFITDIFKENDFDAVVCNFSLLGQHCVDRLISFIPQLLSKDGLIFIQTLHPLTYSVESPYIDGWREESWNGFNSLFVENAPWYFRTLETWIKLISFCGFNIIECIEPIYPDTRRPASIIFIARISEQLI